MLEIIRVGPPARESRSAQKRRYAHREAVMWEEARQDQRDHAEPARDWEQRRSRRRTGSRAETRGGVFRRGEGN